MSETRDTIVLLGLNKSAKYEAEELRKKGNKVIFIGQGNTADQIKFKGNNYSLATRSGITDFVKTLGLSPLQETKLVSALEIGSSDIRDELAQLAIHWTEFEKKGSGASRFILSGHSIERSFWGDDNGILDMGVIKKLAEALPNAAAKIEDLHLSACYSGKE
jgi:hypothetical protein